MIYNIHPLKERIASAVLLQRCVGMSEHAQGVLLKSDGTCDMWKVSDGHTCNEVFVFVEDILHSSAPRHGARDIEEWGQLLDILVQYVPGTIEIDDNRIDFY